MKCNGRFKNYSAATVCACLISITYAQKPQLDAPLYSKTQKSIDAGLRYLAAGQGADGGWEAFGKTHIGVTALAVKCLVQSEQYGPDHPRVKRAVDFLLRYVQPDGGIYDPTEGMRNYHTSVVLMALAATRQTIHKKTIHNAQQFLKKLQWDSGEGHETSSPWYGGQGYGRHKRPDLSNTQMMLEALHQSGLPKDDPVYQQAMIFVSRCQMLGKTNDQSFADESVDGGFVYTPANGGESKAGTDVVNDKPMLRSYGTMTYAGFKSMLYANVDRDDPRVVNAIRWIRKHYTLDHNPNMPGSQSKEGLYYYYHTFSKAMQAWGEDVIVDEHESPHHWRQELREKLISIQNDDGSWLNESDRWYEGNPSLVTAYAVLTLQTTIAQK